LAAGAGVIWSSGAVGGSTSAVEGTASAGCTSLPPALLPALAQRAVRVPLISELALGPFFFVIALNMAAQGTVRN
jgi:hypothetical protein